jgi:hypothetical protein
LSPALPLPSALGSPLPRLSPTSPSPCPTPPLLLLPKRNRGGLICGRGIETRSFPFADQLALRDVLAQVLLDLAAHDVAETTVVGIDPQRHVRSPDP